MAPPGSEAGEDLPSLAEPMQTDAFAELRSSRFATENVHGAGIDDEEPMFRCQATELISGSEPVGWWSPRSFLGELTSGNVGLLTFVRVMSRVICEEIGRRIGLIKRTTLPFRPEEMTGGGKPATPPPGLQPGQLVQIKRGSEISRTLNATGKNRGLWFDREMKVYCGAQARVKTKVGRFIDEKTGKLIELGSDCYILDGVVCQSHRSDGRWLCPRAIYPWWREAWLEPVEPERPSRPAATSSDTVTNS